MKTLEAIIQSARDARPDLTPEEEHYLLYPVNDEAEFMIALGGTLDSLPLDGLEAVVPLLRDVLNGVALTCQFVLADGSPDPRAVEMRRRVSAWREELRVALT